MRYPLNRRAGARALATSAAALAMAAIAPGAAEAAGWDITVNTKGAGGVSGTDGFAYTSTASTPDQSGGSRTKHYSVHPKLCVPFVGCAGGPDPRPVEFTAHPPEKYDAVATWEGCDSVVGNTCNLSLPFPGINQVKARSISVTFTDADRDDDGRPGGEQDCDDNDPRRFKGNVEIPDNGVDEDCDGKDAHDSDKDDDGHVAKADGGDDCDDADKGIHPGAVDRPDNGVDEDCDGVDSHDPDKDDDGYSEGPGGDCNDRDARIHPGARDIPRNGIDEDCKDGDNLDADGDGYREPDAPGKRDCDDGNAAVHPNAIDHPDNGIDEDCDGRDAERSDRDRDGYSRPADCRDDNPGIHPGARDKPRNGTDEDCDGRDADYPAIASDIVHGERGAGRFTKIRRLSVTTPPAGTTVTMKCKGKGCPLKTRTVRAVPGSESLSLVQHFRKAKLAPGARVEVAVRAPESYGKVLRLKIRKGAEPKVAWFKIDPVTGAVSKW